MRLTLFEFEDQSWLPAVIRDGMTDFLQFLLALLDVYKPVTALLEDLMKQTGQAQLLDLCSGGGGYAAQLQAALSKRQARPVRVVLTDKFPNIAKYEYLKQCAPDGLDFESNTIDATAVPENLKGIRTMFSAAHHFSPQTLKHILRSATKARAPIAIFDGGNKNPYMVLAPVVLFPILFLLCTPFIRPFKWSRVLFTYIIPLIPLFTLWDGAASILRLHSLQELEQLASEALPDTYIWKVGNVSSPLGLKINYLIAYPKDSYTSKGV